LGFFVLGEITVSCNPCVTRFTPFESICINLIAAQNSRSTIRTSREDASQAKSKSAA